jgi:2-methylcitrate dehydratase
VGLDHVLLVKVASTATAAQMLGLSREGIVNGISHAWCDGGALRTFRHSPNVGSRKSWAAGDATARGVRLALISRTGEMGIPSILTAKEWGFYDVLFKGKPFEFDRPYGSYVMENVLFKVSYPSGFHIQSAVECAVKLHPAVQGRLDQIKQITIRTHESTMRYLVKKGPLNNPADRDHCVQYVVAIGLIKGDLVAEDYEDDVARDPRIDRLREKMVCVEEPTFTKAYYDPLLRANPNAIRIEFMDGTQLPEVAVEYPIGHRRRREEGWPLLVEKYRQSLTRRFSSEQRDKILSLTLDPSRLRSVPVHEFVDALVI